MTKQYMNDKNENINFPLISASEIGDETVQTVNARDLHAFLEVRTSFKDWINRRVQDYDFEEEKDFSSFLSKSSSGRLSRGSSKLRNLSCGLLTG